MSTSDRGRRANSAVVIYVIILVGFQVFLMSVAVEAFQSGTRSLAWATAIVSVTLAVAAAAFLRYFRP